MRQKEKKRFRRISFFTAALFVLACGIYLDSNKWLSKPESSKTSKSPKLSRPPNSDSALQDENCKRVYEWSLLDHWESNDKAAFDYSKLPQTRTLRLERTWKNPNNKGSRKSKSGGDKYAKMTIHARSSQVNLVVVDMQVFDGTQAYSFAAHNLWHRMIPLYNSWVALQTAMYKYDLLVSNSKIVFYFNCTKHNKHLDDLPNEWENMMGEVSCDDTLLENAADIVIQPPSQGFLWDLAWDTNLLCHNSSMFQAFASLFVNKSSRVEPTEPMGCFISREGRPNRRVANWNETLTMMQDVFPRVQVLTLTRYHTTEETVQILQDCRVLFGVHGAGHANALFTRPGVAVVEMTGNAKPGYFRNINMLLGQYYESIYGDASHGMSGAYTVNLTEARGALGRASEHARLWIKSHGHWR